MKLAKRLIALSLAMVLALSLAACGGGSQAPAPTGSQPAAPTGGDSGETITLTMATQLYVEAPHRAAIDKLVAAYNEKNPNVQIEISGAGYADYWNNLTTAILANNETDIIQVYPENVASYQTLREGGTFLDLTDRFNASGLEGKLTGQETCTYDGKVLGLSNYSWAPPPSSIASPCWKQRASTPPPSRLRTIFWRSAGSSARTAAWPPASCTALTPSPSASGTA